MGSEYFWFLDVLVIALAAAFIFHGARKGAVGVLISSLAAIIAFIAAFALSGPVSEGIYDKFIRGQVDAAVSENLGSSFDREIITGLSKVDMNKAKIRGTYLADIKPEYDSTGTAMLDLSEVDLTETGLENADLKAFGIGEDFDYSLVKVGNVTVKKSDADKYGLTNVVLARVITSAPGNCDIFDIFRKIGDSLGTTISPSLQRMGRSLSSGSRDAMYELIVTILSASGGTPKDMIVNNVVTPTVIVPLKVVVFILIFTVVSLLLNIIASLSKVINRIPIISSVNGVLGAVLGLVEGLIVLFIICAVIKFLIAVCGDGLVFLNMPTIEKTVVFRHLYSFDPLGLLGK